MGLSASKIDVPRGALSAHAAYPREGLEQAAMQRGKPDPKRSLSGGKGARPK